MSGRVRGPNRLQAAESVSRLARCANDAAVEAEIPSIAVFVDLLESRGFEAFVLDSPVRPSLIACRPDVGMLALDVVYGEELGAARVSLNRKVAGLRDDLPALARTPILRRIVDLDLDEAPSQDDLALPLANALTGDWIDQLPRHPVETSVATDLRQALQPRLTVEIPARHAPTDLGAAVRAAERLELDLEQSSAAQQRVSDVLLVTGPPGSGKTLVLIARARWLAVQHPDWHIQILCYNRVLVPYLRSLVADLPSVRVNTFGKFAHAAGYAVSLSDEELALRQVAALGQIAEPVADALLIDEAQDFMPAWVALALSLTFPGRGGVALAGDREQALYRDSALTDALGDRQVTSVQLATPYRSTRQVLRVTAALDPRFNIAGVERAPEGQPVDLVWAHSPAEQAAAVAWDIRLLLDAGEREPRDIAVLVTRKWDIGRIVAALSSAGIPFRTVYPNQADEISLSEDSVKIVTVHSAKGYEFQVVFLVGLEHLSDPDGSARAVQDRRSGFVGFTRAKDQLVVTYTRDNTYLERIRSMPPETLRPWVWPDDYPEADRGHA